MRDIKEHISNRYDSQKIKISGKINPDVHIFNVNEIMASLKIIGFKNIKIQTFGCLTCAYRDTLYYILPKYFKKNLYNTFNLIDQKFFNYFPSNFHCLFNLIATK
jgi:hypothetical protein